MSFIGDFFKSLSNNPNVVNDEEINAELNQFLKDNSESSKRIAFLENNLIKSDDNSKRALEKTAKEAVKKYKSSGACSSNKVEKSHEEEKGSREIGE